MTSADGAWARPVRRRFLAGALALALLPFALQFTGIQPRYATEVLTIGLFALGVNLLMGHTGIVSFGHGLFFGVSVYVCALFQNHVLDSLPLAVLAGTAAATVTAMAVAALIIRKRGIYFSLLTMAFCQMFFYLVHRTRAIGGEDGLSIGGTRQVLGLSLADPLAYYYFVAATLLLAMAAMWMLLNSPFGKVLHAIRDNEARVAFLGLDVRRYVYASFVVSAAFSGLAGALYAFLTKFAFPQLFYWTFSGEVVIDILMGGMRTLIGPVVGSVIFMVLKDVVSSYTEHWMIPVGLLFILVVMLRPEGAVHLVRGLRGRPAEDTDPSAGPRADGAVGLAPGLGVARGNEDD